MDILNITKKGRFLLHPKTSTLRSQRLSKMAPGVSSCYYQEVPPSISFSGSGFMATYQLGVAQCIQNYAPWILSTAPTVLGASAGSLVAAAVVCEMSLSTIRDEMLFFVKQMKAFTLGPLNPSINIFRWLECILHKHLPCDAHKLANGRLSVSMTRLTDGKHIVMSEFHSKEDVVQALLCSCFVPVYCGMLPPTFRGEYYVDGGFSRMQPVPTVPYSQTLTVSPFSGDIDICPADNPCMWDMVVSGSTLKGNMANSLRIFNALYPMALETLEQAYHSGYKDAIQFLQSNDLAPYLMTQKVPQGPLNCYQTKTGRNLEMTVEKDEVESEWDAATLTSFIPNRNLQRGLSTEEPRTRNEPTEDPPLDFIMVKNGLLGESVTYLSMFGLPARILSHLLLPLTLLFYVLYQCQNRLELLFRQTSEVVFWAWHGQKHFTYFFFKICVCSLKKNIEDRIMPSILLLRWLVEAQSDVPQKYAPRQLKTLSSTH